MFKSAIFSILVLVGSVVFAASSASHSLNITIGPMSLAKVIQHESYTDGNMLHANFEVKYITNVGGKSLKLTLPSEMKGARIHVDGKEVEVGGNEISLGRIDQPDHGSYQVQVVIDSRIQEMGEMGVLFE